jgi:hypothetical protein
VKARGTANGMAAANFTKEDGKASAENPLRSAQPRHQPPPLEMKSWRNSWCSQVGFTLMRWHMALKWASFTIKCNTVNVKKDRDGK